LTFGWLLIALAVPAFVVFEVGALALTAPEDFEFRDISVASFPAPRSPRHFPQNLPKMQSRAIHMGEIRIALMEQQR
jgi:hypothetical protein